VFYNNSCHSILVSLLSDLLFSLLHRMTRHNNVNGNSLVHIFTSHFFSQLEALGAEAVRRWTFKLNIFEKKFIFIPVKKDDHWSLVVVVNASQYMNQVIPFSESKASDQICFIMHLDGLNIHCKDTIGHLIRSWLSDQHVIMFNNNENRSTMQDIKIYQPKSPRQCRSCDCAVFVCKYALGLLQSASFPFTVHDAVENFLSSITNNPHFQFDQKDVARMRRETSTLMMKLSVIFRANTIPVGSKVN
jgi:Ulp1 family protease